MEIPTLRAQIDQLIEQWRERAMSYHYANDGPGCCDVWRGCADELAALRASLDVIQPPFFDETGGRCSPVLAEKVRAVMTEIAAGVPGARVAEVPSLFAFGPIYRALAGAYMSRASLDVPPSGLCGVKGWPSEADELLTCALEADHEGYHRSGRWSWLGYYVETPATDVLPAPETTAKVITELYDALLEMTGDLEARWNMNDRSTNPGIRSCVQRARKVLAAFVEAQAQLAPLVSPPPATRERSDLVRYLTKLADSGTVGRMDAHQLRAAAALLSEDTMIEKQIIDTPSRGEHPHVQYLRDLADGPARVDSHKLRAIANELERWQAKPAADVTPYSENSGIGSQFDSQPQNNLPCTFARPTHRAACTLTLGHDGPHVAHDSGEWQEGGSVALPSPPEQP